MSGPWSHLGRSPAEVGGCCSGVPNSDMVQFVSVKLLLVENGWMDQELKQGVYQRDGCQCLGVTGE